MAEIPLLVYNLEKVYNVQSRVIPKSKHMGAAHRLPGSRNDRNSAVHSFSGELRSSANSRSHTCAPGCEQSHRKLQYNSRSTMFKARHN